MWFMLASKDVCKLKYPKTIVRPMTHQTTHELFSKEKSEKRKNMFFAFIWLFAETMWGKNKSTNSIVPTKRKELNNPKSRKATDFKGTNAMKAPTVVMLPTTRGITISFNADFTFGVCPKWAIR